jgi:hypothetical protein
MQINWQWLTAAIVIGAICVLAVWLPFWLASVGGE